MTIELINAFDHRGCTSFRCDISRSDVFLQFIQNLFEKTKKIYYRNAHSPLVRVKKK